MAQPVKYQGVDKESSGYKLLAAMGWQEGSGLGARQQGIREHVKVKKKHDATGVGALEAVAKARDWTAGMAAYDLVLAKMKPVTAATHNPSQQAASDSRKKKRKQPEPASEPLSEPVLIAAASQPQKEKKSKKKKSKEQSHLDADTAAKSDTAALPAATSAAKAAAASKTVTNVQQKVEIVLPKAVASAKGRHIGRYHRVAAAKKAKGYSSSDLAAILGVESLPAAGPAAVTASPSDAQESSEDTTYQTDEPAVLASEHSQCHQQADSVQQQPQRQQIEEQQESEASDQERQWWQSMFVKAGRMGNMASNVQQAGQSGKIKVTGFSEQDQENLYNATQDGKSSGKKGLGKSTQPKAIAGVKWSGKKTVLDGADTDDAANADAANQPERHIPAEAADTRLTSASGAQDGDVAALTGAIKWGKKARRLLSAAPGGKMKLKKLQKQLLQHSQCPEAAWDQMRQDMRTQLSGSRHFRLTDTSIVLA